jgi:hypothetical protein
MWRWSSVDRSAELRAYRQPESQATSRPVFSIRVPNRPANDNAIPLDRRMVILAPWLLCGALIATAAWYLIGQ